MTKFNQNFKSKNGLPDMFILLFLVSMLLIACFVITPKPDSLIYLRCKIFYIPIDITSCALAVSGITCCFLVIYRKGKINLDIISYLLLLKIGVFFLSFAYFQMFGIDGDYTIGVYASYFIAFFAYWIGKNYCGAVSRVVNILAGFSVVMVIQIIIVFVSSGMSLLDTNNMKYWMYTPVGASNSLGVLLVPIYILVNQSYNKKTILYRAYQLFITVGIVLTSSRSAILFLIIYYILLGVDSIKNMIITKKIKISSTIKIILVLASTILTLVIVLSYNNVIFSYLRYFSVDNMTYSRIQVYEETLNVLFEHILIGRNCYTFSAYDAVRAHNWILENLIQVGVIGTIFFIYSIYIIFRKINSNKSDIYVNSVRWFVIIALLHGLVEPNLGGIKFDTIFWFLVGTTMPLCQNSYVRRRGTFDQQLK